MMPIDTAELPMFPLGSVLMPGGVMPLHIFEPRYQQMLNYALERDRTFGVVLISRGSEVGGGELRNSVGTIAHIDEYQRFDDGRAAVVATGHARLEVVDWLADDPFPRAIVTELAVAGDAATDDAAFAKARESFEQLLTIAERAGQIDAVPEIVWEVELEDRSWQLARLAPLSSHDQYQVLAEPTRTARLDRMNELIDAVRRDLELLHGLGD